MSRWLRLFLAVAIGAVIAAPVAIGVGAGLAGMLWIFVFGDNPWPTWVDPAFMTLLTIFALAIWAGLARVIWLQLGARRRAG